MADTGGESPKGTGDEQASGSRKPALHPRALLAADSFEYFDGERRHVPNGYFLETVGSFFQSELPQVIQAAMALTPMLLQSQIKSEHLDEALEIGVYFRYPIPDDAYAATAFDQITNEIYGILIDPRKDLTEDELSYILLHEVRHILQHLSGLDLHVRDDVAYDQDSLKIDADQFAQAVSGLPRPHRLP
jgi:hypothetical protein